MKCLTKHFCSLSHQMLSSVQFTSFQSFSHVGLFVTPWTAECQPSLSITNSRSLIKLMSIESVMPSNHLNPLSSPSPPALNLSHYQGLFKWISSFSSAGQNIGVSASASVLLMNIQDWFPLGWTRGISLLSKGSTRVFSNTTVQKHQFFSTQVYGSTLTSIHDYWKYHSFD